MLLGGLQERVPGLAHINAVSGDQHRALSLVDHINRLLDFLRPGTGPGFAAVSFLAEKTAELGRILKAFRGNVDWKVEVHYVWHAGFQISERIRSVLIDSVRRGDPLTVLLDALGRRLLIHELYPLPVVLLLKGLIAGEHQNGAIGKVCRGDIHDHVCESRPLRARARRDLARRAREAVRGCAHPSFRPPSVTGNSDLRDLVDD